MRKILLLFLIIVLVCSCKKNELLNTYWVAVESRSLPNNNAHAIYDGLIIHLQDKKLTFNDVYYAKKHSEFDLEINQKNIFLNDTLWAAISSKYEDSLILDIRKNTRVKFVKLDKKHSSKLPPDTWNHRNWILSYNNYDRELFLKDSLFFDEPGTKLCLQKDLVNNQIVNTIDKWRGFSVNGNQIFVKTFYQSDYEIYRVKSSNDSILNLESLRFPEVRTYLKKIKYINEYKKEKIFNLIKNKKWEIEKVNKIDTVGRGSRYNDTLIKFHSLLNGKISFQFLKDSTYHIYELNSLVQKGEWSISPTGNEIVLNTGLHPNNYIDIINLTEKNLTIGHLGLFENQLDEYDKNLEVYYKVNLINNGG